MSKLSIIIPIYNAEKFIPKCLDSVLGQTINEFELICVNDGSTDASLDVIKKYAGKDERIRIIDKKNGGSLSARKEGVRIATGDYIGFVDADDWIEADMYECLMNAASTHSADIVSCGYYLEEANSKRIVYEVKEKEIIEDPNNREIFFEGFLATGFDWVTNRNITPSLCNKVFRKSILESVYSEIDERIILEEDTVTMASAVLNSKCLVLIPEILYHYKIYASSKSHRLNKNIMQSYAYVFNELNRISEEHDGILDNQIPYFSLSGIRTALEVGFGVESGKQYMFPFDKIKQGRKIIIYGAGQVGRNYYNEVSSINYASEVYLADSNPENWSEIVLSPDEVFKRKYDIVLIAVENESTAEKIRESIINRGVEDSKIFWQKPVVLKDTYSFRVNRR